MALKIKLNKPVDLELKHNMQKCIDDTVNRLKSNEENMDDAIHDVRKNMKRIRAFLRLVRYNIPEEKYKELNTFYRDIARQYAPYREAEVHAKTFEHLVIEDRLTKAKSAMYEILYAHYKSSNHQLVLKDEIIEKSIDSLKESKKGINELKINSKGFDTFYPGLRKVYRQGRKALKAAQKTPDSVNLHEWRKRIKYLMYQLRLIRNAWPKVIKVNAKSLDKLSDYLGQEHDLAELKNIILDTDLMKQIPVNEKNELAGKIDKRRLQLRSGAWPLGKCLYIDKPGVFTDRIAKYWNISVGKA